MLTSIKSYINELPDMTFAEFYQRYICDVQDMNIKAEIEGVKTDEITSLSKLLSRLKLK